MSSRERILAILVGGLAAIVGLQIGFGRFRDALALRETKLKNLEGQLVERQKEEFAGLQADTQLARYRRRSLPNDAERAQSQYKEWLEQVVGQSELQNRVVDYVGDHGSGNHYRVFTFRVAGVGNVQQIADFMAAFHEQHYLHRAKKFVLRPNDDHGSLLMNLDIEAMAVNDAAPDQPPPDEIDPRTPDGGGAFVEKIAERNLFFPPNQPPKYVGTATMSAHIDRDFLERLRFEDPEHGGQIDLQVDESSLPPGLELSKGQIIGRAKEKGVFSVRVTASDNGLPRAVTEQLISIQVTDPPPQPDPPAEPAPYDESQQAILTGLVQSRGAWRAWIHIRTKNKLLKLAVGDNFEVGKISGKIVEINEKFAIFESDGQQYTLHQDKSLADAHSG